MVLFELINSRKGYTSNSLILYLSILYTLTYSCTVYTVFAVRRVRVRQPYVLRVRRERPECVATSWSQLCQLACRVAHTLTHDATLRACSLHCVVCITYQRSMRAVYYLR